MNAYIFAALPIVALAAVAFLGLRWLRQPVDNEQKAATASDAPKITSLLQNVAESARRIVETNSELALCLDQPTPPSHAARGFARCKSPGQRRLEGCGETRHGEKACCQTRGGEKTSRQGGSVEAGR